MAPVSGKASPLIYEKIRIAGVEVDALVDTGARHPVAGGGGSGNGAPSWVR